MVTFPSFISILVFVTVANSKDLFLKDDPCAKFDTCYAKPSLRTCDCDDDCHMFGTCCQDAIKGRLRSPSSEFQCYHQHTVTPVFVKRFCKEDFKGHPDFIADCFDDDVDDMDVISNLLLTSRRTKTSYWNSRCARCNDEIDDDLEFWNIEVFCPPKAEVDRHLIRKNLTYNEDTKQWGLVIDGEFIHCVVKYTPPPFIDEVKHCTPNLISSCPANYSNDDISKKCSTYYGERKLKSSDVYYKNIHCAICNGIDVADLECPGMSKPEDIVEETDFREMVEEVFTRGHWIEKKSEKKFQCSKGFTYDPFWKRCRNYVEPIIPMPVVDKNSSPSFERGYAVLWVALLMFLF